jgi:hypothetical protein
MSVSPKVLRRLLAIAAVVFALVLFSFPSMAQNVETDYDHAVDFSQLHTYTWGHVHSDDPFFEQRVKDAVDHELQSKGWQEVPTGGDVTITAVAVKRHQTEYNTFYTGLGPHWGWRGWGTGMATTNVERVPIGTLIIDLYDTNTENLIWRGEAHSQLSDKPDKDTKKVEKAVEKMFDKFPPRRE